MNIYKVFGQSSAVVDRNEEARRVSQSDHGVSSPDEASIEAIVADCLARFRKVQAKIEQAALQAERKPSDVMLVVASKTQPKALLQALLSAGHRCFGENRVQEGIEKWPDLRSAYPDTELRLIGSLQTNKVRHAVDVFDAIETLDRAPLLEALAKETQRRGTQPELFVQINTGDEPQKSGVSPQASDAFLDTCARVYGLKITGLMCVPPQHEQASPHFALLSQIAKRNGIGSLSMGMSSDYPLAIQLGATHVRVGSEIFGPRSAIT
jgi:pyridoxal phosphate enzyme (YggS family)